MPGPDLHIHSNASDGALAPQEIVARAAALGLPAIAITDHDTVAGVGAALEAGRDRTLEVIPAVELSAGLDGRGMHILGYFIDSADQTLATRLTHLRSVRIDRAERIVASLQRGGLDVTLHDVLDAADGGAVGRAHIAHVLVATGHAASVSDAFDRLLGSGRPHYVPKPTGTAAEVIGWIREAGGVAVVAHPALSGIDDLIGHLASLGIVGIEAYHGSHDHETRQRYVRLAAAYGLVCTGGSDFHGDDAEGNPLGSADVPDTVLVSLRAAHRSQGPGAGR
ncbi:MAG: PHP domain-containing protein [Coriobacteriia bacterium]|nr:PHP domain-containing protein [Coriobacteriia bacterium]